MIAVVCSSVVEEKANDVATTQEVKSGVKYQDKYFQWYGKLNYLISCPDRDTATPMIN